MPTHRPSIMELSISQLERLTGKSYKVIKKRLAELIPVRTDGKTVYYEPRAALSKIYETTNVHAERARFDRVRADKVELELAEKGGRLVDVEQVAKWWEHIVNNAKSRLLAIPTKAAPLVIGCKTLPQVKEALDSHIREALLELSATNPVPSGRTGKPVSGRTRRL